MCPRLPSCEIVDGGEASWVEALHLGCRHSHKTMSMNLERQMRERFMERLIAIFDFIFGCHHSHLSRVFTIGGRTYRVCCSCGAKFKYLLESMSIEGGFGLSILEGARTTTQHALPSASESQRSRARHRAQSVERQRQIGRVRHVAHRLGQLIWIIFATGVRHQGRGRAQIIGLDARPSKMAVWNQHGRGQAQLRGGQGLIRRERYRSAEPKHPWT
jgi:hypothetical protein